MSRPEDSPLGRPVDYAGHYDASRLFAIARAPARAALGLAEPLPFHGVDLWNAYELSWLDARGKPQVALAEFEVPASSPNLVESKSLKLYLNGFMQTRVDDREQLRATIAADLAQAAGAPVQVRLLSADTPPASGGLAGDCIDALDIAIDRYAQPEAGLLAATDESVEETLVSHLLKSNCPVTGQPDWASVQIAYRGRRLDRGALLRYLVAFREHAGFHEQCVEMIFRDVAATIEPQALTVYARYTRRGGLDINPLRSLDPAARPENLRLGRQ
jgi:7-cyano-7-deazaguanine reductase